MDTKFLKVPSINVVKCKSESAPAWKEVKKTRGALSKNARDGYKVCYVCEEEKPLEEFSGNATRADGKQTYCKKCGHAKQTEWYYKRKHGITMKERDALLAAQDGKCGACGNTIAFKENKGRGLNTGDEAVVDHCHTSGKIRGVLCGHCNTGLGAFKDNVSSLEGAIQYLLTRQGE